jgi:hypothetical protein
VRVPVEPEETSAMKRVQVALGLAPTKVERYWVRGSVSTTVRGLALRASGLNSAPELMREA